MGTPTDTGFGMGSLWQNALTMSLWQFWGCKPEHPRPAILSTSGCDIPSNFADSHKLCTAEADSSPQLHNSMHLLTKWDDDDPPQLKPASGTGAETEELE
eukprot:15477115-Alexandrium_andersonii.AAC.1